jgi:hypothetical protein
VPFHLRMNRPGQRDLELAVGDPSVLVGRRRGGVLGVGSRIAVGSMKAPRVSTVIANIRKIQRVHHITRSHATCTSYQTETSRNQTSFGNLSVGLRFPVDTTARYPRARLCLGAGGSRKRRVRLRRFG